MYIKQNVSAIYRAVREYSKSLAVCYETRQLIIKFFVRRFAAIRLAATPNSLSQELSRMVKNAKEENNRRGGWVRVFPTADSW